MHCKAGLGRTGCLIGCYIMKHYKFSAEEVSLCYVMMCYVMLCYVVLCYAMLCYVMLYYDTL